MLTKETIYSYQEKGELNQIFDDCFCGGEDFGVYRKGSFIYKIDPFDTETPRMLHPDAAILTDLKDSPYFPSLISEGEGFVCMTYERGIPLDEFDEEQYPSWALPFIKEAITHAIEKGYMPFELEPRHVLIDEGAKRIKVVDVTAYEKFPSNHADSGYKEELIATWYGMFTNQNSRT